MAEQKTNVMRILDQKKIPYRHYTYPHGDAPIDGIMVASLIGKTPDQVFKTLVTAGSSKANYVFVIPSAQELDLKKAAKVVGEKSVSMLHVNQLLPLTGYVRGGCSPIGMKKQFKTILHISCESMDTIIVSAGKVGWQVELSPKDLMNLIGGISADVTVEV